MNNLIINSFKILNFKFKIVLLLSTRYSVMNKIDRYIVKQYLTSFFFILGIVLAICILVDVVEKMDDFPGEGGGDFFQGIPPVFMYGIAISI